MITYKGLKDIFAGHDIEYVKSFYDMLGIHQASKKLLHKVKKTLKYLGLRNIKFKDISIQKRKGI